MKSLSHHTSTPTQQKEIVEGSLSAESLASLISINFRQKQSELLSHLRKYRMDPSQFLAQEAVREMAKGKIPNLSRICLDLYGTFFSADAPYSAHQFVPILHQLTHLDSQQIERFLKNPTTNHVLVQNEWMKVVLIHWKPGKSSSVHGHPQGGCVFKVLHGRVEEKRYSPDASSTIAICRDCLSGHNRLYRRHHGLSCRWQSV